MASYRSQRRVHPTCVPTIVLVLCTGAWSAEFGGASGMPDDPYQIWTPEQMNAIGADPNTWDKHFKLMADIDLSAYSANSFNIIGAYPFQRRPRQVSIVASAGPFSGVFDGNDHAILNFHYSYESAAYVGLFGCVDGPGAEIRNLRLVSPKISAKNSSYVGSLVGALGRGAVTDCHAIDVDLAGRNNVGGLIGEGSGIIEDSSSSGIVEGANCTGGLVGRSGGTIRRCCSSAIVLGNDYTGGLAGYGSDVTADSYATGVVVGGQYVGGLKGEGADTITRCYAACLVIGTGYTGGLVGYGSGSSYYYRATASFWDIDTSGQDSSSGGVGKPTALMQTVATFLKAGWDFAGETANGTEDIWWIAEGQDYPRLRWEAEPGQMFEPLQLSGLLKGTGTADDPFLISTAEDLNLVGLFPGDWDKHFKLTADVDLRAYRGEEFNLIGRGLPRYSYDVDAFTGVFDGNGHAISNLTWSSSDTNSVGLFRSVAGEQAQIRDLRLVSPHIGNGTNDCAGGLIGILSNGTVVNCGVEGGIVTGRNTVGGLIGYNYRGTVDSSLSTAMVIGENGVGGLMGSNSGEVTDSYATGTVIGDSGVGGLLGSNESGVVAYCYSAGRVIGETITGGFMASEGRPRGTVRQSFWDTEASGQTQMCGTYREGTTVCECDYGRTTTQMQRADTFRQWAHCDTRWTIDDGNDYPRLWWENRPGEPINAVPLSDFLAGEGTQERPYLIYTAEELSLVCSTPCDWDKHFRLVADIDFAASPGANLSPIGCVNGTGFTGVFDGNDHTISNLRLTVACGYGAGLFGCMDDPNAEIKDLHLVDPNIDARTSPDVGSMVGYLRSGTIAGCSVTGGAVSGREYTGGLLGYCGDGVIAGCSSTATVTGGGVCTGGLVGSVSRGEIVDSYAAGFVAGTSYVGGLAGSVDSGAVTDSYAVGPVTGVSLVGGLLGFVTWSTIANSYAAGPVTGTSDLVGGLVGSVQGVTIVNCYATGSVAGRSAVGGFAGYLYSGTVTNSYATGFVTAASDVGGLAGRNYMGQVAGSFWNVETSGQTAGLGGTGKTTAEMQMESTFRDAGWDFVGETDNGTEDIWWIDEGKDYPRLWWEASDGASL